jgi:hypothetical protein
MKYTNLIADVNHPDLRTGLVTVLERIPLQAKYSSAAGALLAGQAYEDAAHENAHRSSGHVSHALFHYEPPHRGQRCGALLLWYQWASAAEVSNLLASEEGLLADWFTKYAVGPRTITLLQHLRVGT